MSNCKCEGPIKIKTRVSHTCGSCQKIVKGFQFKKKLKYAAIIGVIGYGSGQAMESIFFDNRYPLDVEYSIIDACVNSSGKALSSRQYQNKQKLCLCAVEDTINDVSYSSFKSSEHLFNQSLQKSLNKC